MAEYVLMSEDPKDPRWRFRVAEATGAAEGLFEILEEELTSTSPSAQVSGVTARVLMTRPQAEWMRDVLAKVLATTE